MLTREDIELIREIVATAVSAEFDRREDNRKKELHRERQQRYRDRLRVTQRDANVTQCDASHEGKRDANGDADAGSPPFLPLFPSHTLPITPSSSTPPTIKKDKTRPRDYEEVLAWCLKCNLTEDDAIALWEHWKGNSFTNNGRRMGNWKFVISTWERRGIFFPSLKPQYGNNNKNHKK